MTDRRPNPIRDLQKLMKKDAEWNYMIEFVMKIRSSDVGNNRSEKSDILIMTGFVEQCIKDAIKKKLGYDDRILDLKIFDGDAEREAILGSLYSRATFAQAIGFYGPETYKDLSNLRIIRNTFAHAKIEISLQDSPLADLCNLNFVRNFYGTGLARPTPSTPIDKLSSFVFFFIQFTYWICFQSEGERAEESRAYWRQIFL